MFLNSFTNLTSRNKLYFLYEIILMTNVDFKLACQIMSKEFQKNKTKTKTESQKEEA